MKFRANKSLSTILAIFLIAMLVLSGCKPEGSNPQNEEQQNANQDVAQKVSLSLSLEEYPVMDGSTANLPMMAEIMSRVCGITLQEAEEFTSCSKTSQAWLNLAYGSADILLVYEAPEETKTMLADIGEELEITPVGRDALVFINNEQNPVDNLTQAQLIDIYTGKTTNWQEVGGKDLEIVPYQRVATSGSQSLFLKLLMQDCEPMDAPTELRPAEMGMLIDELAKYNNEGSALGYSVFYYANYMYQQPGLRMIAVDDVVPSDESIADGSYPLLNEYYVAIRADEPENSPARQLRDWILSEEGREAILAAGYIPIPAE